MSILTGKRIILGVTGSIAAYKAADLASRLTQLGALVDVLMTESAEKFVSMLTFQSVTGRKTYTETDLWGGEAHILHVGLANNADLLVIAPCTANTLANLVQGQAGNLLTITALAMKAPILVAPAMDSGMFDHPATRENVRVLKERGIYFAGPAEGRMASGLKGRGRMLEPAEIIGHIRMIFGRSGPLAGKRLVITAGGSQEPIDPVRYITNRSSGKQGYALAQAALDAGAAVRLITHPTALTVPLGAEVVEVGTAHEMLDAVLESCWNADGLVMAAAVADFQVAQVSDHKLKKQDGIPQLELVEAPDVLAKLAGLRGELPRLKVVVGFAAESHDLLENAARKLAAKKLDFIAANDISARNAGFGVDTNRVTLLYADGTREALAVMSKEQVAEIIIGKVAGLLD